MADGPTGHVVTSSPMFAPQVAKILSPEPWLTVDDVSAALFRAHAPIDAAIGAIGLPATPKAAG